MSAVLYHCKNCSMNVNWTGLFVTQLQRRDELWCIYSHFQRFMTKVKWTLHDVTLDVADSRIRSATIFICLCNYTTADIDVIQQLKGMHRCQPSRIRRDSPAFSSDVPWNETDVPLFRKWFIIFFVADYSTFLPRNATKWRTSNKDRFKICTPTDHWSIYTVL